MVDFDGCAHMMWLSTDCVQRLLATAAQHDVIACSQWDIQRLVATAVLECVPWRLHDVARCYVQAEQSGALRSAVRCGCGEGLWGEL